MKNLLTILGVVLLLGSCEKAELKKPTRVNFAFGLNKAPGQSSVKINAGEINLVDFNITGDRIEGDDIAFNRSFSERIIIDVNGSGEVKELDFDLPQGEYSSILLNFNIDEDGADPALRLTGTYKPTSGPVHALIFEYFGSQTFNVTGEDDLADPTIVMDKDFDKKVTIEFDPVYWFESLTANQLDNADVNIVTGQDEIILSSTSNVALYEIVLNRMEDSNKAIFK